MVTLPQAITSNKRIAATLPEDVVAVFVGGTSGVGEYTVKAFAKYVSRPRVYIIGRSQEAAEGIIRNCQGLNPSGTFEFLQADISLLAAVDDVCRTIKSKEKYINLLFQTQGTMGFSKSKLWCSCPSPKVSVKNHHTATSEGLPLAFATGTHSRLRFTMNLIPLLREAPTLRRVISVGAASYEGPIDLTNLPGQGLALPKWRDQIASIQTLLLEEVARRAAGSGVSFAHTVPGVVKSGIMRDMESSLSLRIIVGISKLLAPLIETSPEECGERQLFYATSAKYAASPGGGVPLESGLMVAKGTDGKMGSGMYSIDVKGGSAPATVEKLLAGFGVDGTAKQVWESISSDLVRITGTQCLV